VHLLKRAWHVFADARFERPASLSMSHLYNLRHSKIYQNQRVSFVKTRPVVNPIDIRRAPRPQGRLGFIRIIRFTKVIWTAPKGVYHVNAVDIVTQWEVVATCERISEVYLLHVLQDLIEQSPFEILGLHSDNGSEYINKTEAALLEKMRIDQTKSHSRHSNDNALAEEQKWLSDQKGIWLQPHTPALCRSHQRVLL